MITEKAYSAAKFSVSILKLKLRQKCGGEILQKTHFAHGNFISYPLEKYSTFG